MTRGRKPNPNKVEKEHLGRGRKSTKSDAERFCAESIKIHGMFGCKARNDGEYFPDPCPIGGNYGCKYSGLKKRHMVKENAND